MRLIDVDVFLTREKKIQKQETAGCDVKPVLRELEDSVTDYAILSHRWVVGEVGYMEMLELEKMENRNEI